MKRKEWADKRYKTANREALLGVALVIFNFIWWFGFAYGLGSRSLDSYHYIFGFPAWFFFSCILGFIVMMVLTVLVVKFFFKDMSLEAEDEK